MTGIGHSSYGQCQSPERTGQVVGIPFTEYTLFQALTISGPTTAWFPPFFCQRRMNRKNSRSKRQAGETTAIP